MASSRSTDAVIRPKSCICDSDPDFHSQFRRPELCRCASNSVHRGFSQPPAPSPVHGPTRLSSPTSRTVDLSHNLRRGNHRLRHSCCGQSVSCCPIAPSYLAHSTRIKPQCLTRSLLIPHYGNFISFLPCASRLRCARKPATNSSQNSKL